MIFISESESYPKDHAILIIFLGEFLEISRYTPNEGVMDVELSF